MPEKEFVLDLEVGVRMRCWHRTERGEVVAFTVQLELLIGRQWGQSCGLTPPMASPTGIFTAGPVA